MTLQQKLVKHSLQDGNNYINESVYTEVWSIIQENIQDYLNLDIWRMQTDLFNQNDYIIYYDEGEEWLKKHNLSVWDLMAFSDEKNMAHFGELSRRPENCPSCINEFIYWISFDLCAIITTEFEGIEEDLTQEIINKVIQTKFK